MAVIRVENFGGEMPRESARGLPSPMAQENSNLLATSKEFRPLLADTTVATGVSGARTLYRLQRGSTGALVTGDTTGWLTDAAELNYVKGQLNDDATERTLLSYNNGSAAPRVVDATGANRLLGVPAPVLKPTITLVPGAELTLEEANLFAAGTVMPAIISAFVANMLSGEPTSRFTAGAPVAGPYSLYGLTLPTHPTSQRGVFEPWMLILPVPLATAQSTRLIEPQLGGVTVGATYYLGIRALPFWGRITSTTNIQTALRLLLHPTTGAQLFSDAQLPTIVNDIADWFSTTSGALKTKRDALDEAVKMFKASYDYLVQAPPTAPTEPARPTVPEYNYDLDPPGRNSAWVTYDAAYKTYETALEAYRDAQAKQDSDRASKVAAMASARATADRITADIESLWASKVERFEQQVLEYLNQRGIAKSDLNPNGLVVVDADRIVDSRFYLTTFVTDWGEESAPGPVSDLLEVDQNDSVRISRPIVPSGRNIQKWRIYRSNVGTTSADFQFVEELLIGSTTYDDALKSSELGEICPTITWAEPPYRMDSQSAAIPKPVKGTNPYLRGMVGMPNGIMAAFLDNTVAFCHPYIQYAWPVEYQITTEYPIVGLGVFGQTLFVGTLSNPYLISGSDSASMSAQKLDAAQACESQRSIVAAQGGVFYASPDGLCFASQAGVEVITLSLFAREDWQALVPSSIVAALHEGVYYFTYTGNGGGCYALDTVARKLVRTDLRATAFFYDPIADGLYFVNGTQIRRAFTAGRRTGKWRSPRIILPLQAPLAWVQADGNQAPGTPVIVRWYGDGVLRHTATLTNTTPQRLPAGRYLEHEVEVESTARVTKVLLAGSTQELQSV